jgi:hydroxymethylpyrimidine/phosphomethylpyrimidine kinase
MPEKRPYVMSIAGYDPSGGAGILADIKVIEQHKAYGFGVITSNTLQNDREVKDVKWISVSDIKRQIDIILDSFKVDVFKIGLIDSSYTFLEIKDHILKKRPSAKIIWDPILRSSSGYEIFRMKHDLSEILENVHLVTPNLPEYEELFETEKRVLRLSLKTAVYLKGGHSKDKPGTDILYHNKKKLKFEPGSLKVTDKHGSGCILSSAIGANLAYNITLPQACEKAKHYTEKVLASNASLLAWHHH